MAKFKHQDEEEFDIFCEICQEEHSSGIPESKCRDRARKGNDQFLQKERQNRADKGAPGADEDDE